MKTGNIFPINVNSQNMSKLPVLMIFLISSIVLMLAIPANSQIVPHEKICNSHLNCSECAASPSYCHWCASDDVCHSTLNWMEHQCIIGSTCPSLSIEQCERTEPEPIPSTTSDVSIAFASTFGIFTVGVLVMHCILRCGTKKKYVLSETFDHDTDTFLEERCNVHDEHVETILTTEGIEMASTFGTVITPHNDDRYAMEDPRLEELQLQDVTNGEEEDPEPEKQNDVKHYFPPSRLPFTLLSSFKAFLFASTRWFGVLAACGFLATLLLSVVIIYPSEPVVNICSTRVAWRSLLQNAITLNDVKAPFNLLLSISNTNVMGINLDLKSGSIRYDAQDGRSENIFGDFEANEISIEPNTITDFNVDVNIYPSRIQKPLVMMGEFIGNTLVFDVDADMGITLPSFFGYSFNRKWTHSIEFTVNELVDLVNSMDESRILCSCAF